MPTLAGKPEMSQMNTVWYSLAVCIGIFLMVPVATSKEEVDKYRKPNIIIFLVDDLGYGDLSPYGHPTSSTPHIQKLADQGLIFTQFYAASPVGSPTRAALLTGRYPIRSGIYPGEFTPDDLGGLPSNEITLAEVLKKLGYRTGTVGKWQLGIGDRGKHLPHNHGFDYYMGVPNSHSDCPCNICFYPNQLCHQTCDPLKRTPFFLLYSFHHTHAPHFSGKQFRNSSIRGPFGDSLSEVDHGVGQIMQTLMKNNLYSNTFIFLTSANGPDLNLKNDGGSAGHLRCGKGSTWEGGMRVPAIAWWSGKIGHNHTHQLGSSLDLFPTILKMVGVKSTTDNKIDGVDLSSVLLKNKRNNQRDWVPYYPEYINRTEGPHAIRWREYKAHYYTRGGYCPEDYFDSACRSNATLQHHNPPLLFNLHTDPGEIFPLNPRKYSLVLEKIGLIRRSLLYGLDWGTSQTQIGRDKWVQLCGDPGCYPFPYCCKVNSLSQSIENTL